MPYGTVSYTYCACIAKVAFLSIFHFFYDLHDLLQIKLHTFTAKKLHGQSIFLYMTYIFHTANN